MYIMHVHIHIKPEYIEQFKIATQENAFNSVEEPGIARFDVFQQNDDPNRFVLVEAYRNQEATVEHKKTAHYLKWLETVTDMMAEPRTRVYYTNIFPDDDNW